MHHWIAEPAVLSDQLASWRGITAIALDTEFIRERTWWPQLALVQLAAPGEDRALLVDATVPGMALALRPLLADPTLVKLMHSASEDLQALLHACGCVPQPLFDTQIAAALCGIGTGIGYQKLVENLLGITLPKDQTRSDWLHRPLSPAQLAYAADDVLHLHAVHAILRDRLRELGRESWQTEDSSRLASAVGADLPERWPHLALRGAQGLPPPAQARLCRLLRWRETVARASDRPKGWVLDSTLALTLARKPPATRPAFHALLDATPKAPRRMREELWELLTTPPGDDESDMPLASAHEGAAKMRLRELQDAVATQAARLGIDPSTLASRRMLEALLNEPQSHAALPGWRRDVLEPVLAPILAS